MELVQIELAARLVSKAFADLRDVSESPPFEMAPVVRFRPAGNGENRPPCRQDGLEMSEKITAGHAALHQYRCCGTAAGAIFA
jgi:hypothetical protein